MKIVFTKIKKKIEEIKTYFPNFLSQIPLLERTEVNCSSETSQEKHCLYPPHSPAQIPFSHQCRNNTLPPAQALHDLTHLQQRHIHARVGKNMASDAKAPNFPCTRARPMRSTLITATSDSPHFLPEQNMMSV